MSERGKAQKALDAIRKAKETGGKRSVEIEEAESVYDTVTEEEYEKRVSAKRMEKSWIVGDDGYNDYGDDAIEEGEEYEDTVSKTNKKRRRKAKEESKTTNQRIDRLFAQGNKSSSTSEPPAKKPKYSMAETKQGFDAALNDLLANPFDDDGSATLPVMSSLYTVPAPKKSTTEHETSDLQIFNDDTTINDADDGEIADARKTNKDVKPAEEKDTSSIPPKTTKIDSKPSTTNPTPSTPKATIATPSPAPITTPTPNNTNQAKGSLNTPTSSNAAKAPEKEKPKVPITSFVTDDKTWSALTSNAKGDDNLVQGTTSSYSSSSAPEMPPLNADQQVSFYWLDMHEDSYISPGSIYLFGKVWNEKTKKFSSCAVFIKNVERTLIVAPREVTIKKTEGSEEGEKVEIIKHVIPEIESIRTKMSIGKMRYKIVKRKYHFDQPGVKQGESEFLKVKYGYDKPELREDLISSGNSFAHIFGVKTPAVENFIIHRKLMGPSWILIKNPIANNAKRSWCTFECTVDDPRNIILDANDLTLKPPPLTVMSLKVQVVMNIKEHKNEIAAVSAVYHNDVIANGPTKNSDEIKMFTIVRKLPQLGFPINFENYAKQKNFPVHIQANERALLGILLGKIQLIDPDVIVGHNFLGFDLDVLLHRMKDEEIPNWSRIGRLQRSKMPVLQAGAGGAGESTQSERQAMMGRLVCDTYLSCKEFIKQKDYKLSTLAKSQLGLNKDDIDVERVPEMYGSAETLLELCKHASIDATLALKLVFKINVLPLTRQLTQLCGNRWVRSLTGARAERIEYLLMHEFYNQKPKYVLPDKVYEKTKSKKREKAKYGGGLVLEPKIGFYDNFILLLDFNSLYPSVIQEYNVCFTTIPRKKDASGKWEEVLPPPPHVEVGTLPRVIRNLVLTRRKIKGQIKATKDPVQKSQLDIQQLAVKLVANSMYGCLGFKSSRFFALPLAQLITSMGREALKRTVDTATSKLGLEVIYGDTDSIMVNTKCKDLAKVKSIGYEVKSTVNKVYKELEIEIDGIFASMLLLKKKKYAALVATDNGDNTYSVTKESKGLDLVRRDWCELSASMGSVVLDFILAEGKSREDVVLEIHNFLRTKSEEIRSGKIPLEQFIITKGISRAPEDYTDKNLPHIQVALANKRAGLPVKPGDFIQYLIFLPDTTTDSNNTTNNNKPSSSSSHHLSSRAISPVQFKKEDKKLDIDWYLANQIHPPISRLCAPIEGTDSALIAECLGLDATKFNSSSSGDNNELDDFRLSTSVRTSDTEKYQQAEKIHLKCSSCLTSQVFEGVYCPEMSKVFEGLKCINASCNRTFSSASIQNQLDINIRKHIKRYYAGAMVCKKCNTQTRQLFIKNNNKPKCVSLIQTNQYCNGTLKLEYDTTMLYNQLCYYRDTFDIDRALSRSHLPVEKLKRLEEDILGRFGVQKRVFDDVCNHVKKIINQNEYHNINLKPLFGFFNN
eukprot:TRINITY_DN11290_c0_g1_i1.p1 TRINITY_DN11290_c0_g1~~TRINITY_DN11290_c0_g1_i1.p1  ORF type:complete len:1462 (-),score=412.66 TRINITY_DN11290_c0_g1_i1:67-4452(-)